jgi:hypothetical protein
VCSHVVDLIWEMGRWGHMEQSGGGGAVVGAHRSKPLMVTGGPKGSRIPSSPMRGVHRVGDTLDGKWNRDLTCC